MSVFTEALNHLVQAPISPVPSPNSQPTIGSGQLYGIRHLYPAAPTYTGAYQTLPSSFGPSSSSQKELSFPERPGQPECQYYMRTGDCKFGSSCRYHHPPELVAPPSNVVLSPMGLPLRPVSLFFQSFHIMMHFIRSCVVSLFSLKAVNLLMHQTIFGHCFFYSFKKSPMAYRIRLA